MMRFLRRFARERDGGAAVEFGLIAPLLIAVAIGMSAVGGEVLERHAMRRAVSSGAQVLMATDADLTAVRDVTLDAWSGKKDGASVVVTQWCSCASIQHSCSTNCSDGDYPERYTKIAAATPYTGPLGQQTLATSQMVRTR
jgi:Flp pilus assembly pilin Flp